MNAELLQIASLFGAFWTAVFLFMRDPEAARHLRFLAGLAITFRVGPADTLTSASRRLPNVDAVQALLEWIGQHDPVGPQSS